VKEKVQDKDTEYCSREIKIHVQLLINLLEFLSHSLAHLSHRTVFTIILYTIIERQIDVLYKLLKAASILIESKLVLYCGKVHRFCHNIEVVRDLKLFRINRLVENPGLISFPKFLY